MPAPDPEALERRLEAVERAVGEGTSDHGPASTPAVPEELTAQLDALEARVAELDAALQAVRGYLGGVDAVNEGVEARANAAVAAVERLERRLDEGGADTGGLRARDTGDPVPDEPETPSCREAEQPPLRERLREQW